MNVHLSVFRDLNLLTHPHLWIPITGWIPLVAVGIGPIVGHFIPRFCCLCSHFYWCKNVSLVKYFLWMDRIATTKRMDRKYNLWKEVVLIVPPVLHLFGEDRDDPLGSIKSGWGWKLPQKKWMRNSTPSKKPLLKYGIFRGQVFFRRHISSKKSHSILFYSIISLNYPIQALMEYY